MTRQRKAWLLPASVVVALLLGLLPLPASLLPLRPYWPARSGTVRPAATARVSRVATVSWPKPWWTYSA